MCHEMYVINFILIGDRLSSAAVIKFVGDEFSHDIFVQRVSEFELADVTFVMFNESETSIEITIERGQFIEPTVNGATGLPGKLWDEKRGEWYVDDDSLVNRFPQHSTHEFKQL